MTDLDYLRDSADLRRRFAVLNPSRSITRPAALANTASIRRETAKPNDGLHPLFRAALLDVGLPLPEREYQFHDTRKWRFDYCWRQHRVALEQNGGAFTGGRHTRGQGFVNDMAKLSEAAAMGWLVVQCQPDDLCKSVTLDRVKRAIEAQRGRVT